MKKLLILIGFALLFIPNLKAEETNITIDEKSIKYENSTIKLSGTSEEEDVQVAVFDGDTLLIYGVTGVTGGNYNYVSPKITLQSNKEYSIKVSTVDGQAVKNGTLLISDIVNPKTGDTIINSIVIGAISFLAIVGFIILFKRKEKID